MKGLVRLFGLIGIMLLVLLIFSAVNGNKKEEANKELSKKHCEMEWKNSTAVAKEEALREFMANDGIDPLEGGFKSPSMVAAELLPKYVKYPETIMIGEKPFEGWIYLSSGTIENLEEGVVSFSKNFTSKNKLGMEVRSSFIMTLKYQAGCNNFELIDFVVG